MVYCEAADIYHTCRQYVTCVYWQGMAHSIYMFVTHALWVACTQKVKLHYRTYSLVGCLLHALIWSWGTTQLG